MVQELGQCFLRPVAGVGLTCRAGRGRGAGGTADRQTAPGADLQLGQRADEARQAVAHEALTPRQVEGAKVPQRGQVPDAGVTYRAAAQLQVLQRRRA
jgi:hypothetical protein